MITLFDPRIGYVIKLYEMPKIDNGFIFLNWEVREIMDIHETSKGMQIELWG